MTSIEIKARKLVESLLNDHLPDKELIVTVIGEFSGLNYPTINAKIPIDSEDIIEFLIQKNILELHEKQSSSNAYPVKPTRFIVSFSQQVAEDFIDTITVGEFRLKLSTGEARYRDNVTKFKPGSQPYKLYKTFIENPKKRFEYDDLCEIVGKSQDSLPKEIQDLVNKEIKERLRIPAKHFQADYGYMFIP